MSNGNKKAGPELAPAWPGRRPSITSLAELAAHLGRELSVSAVDANGWTDLHYAAALDWPATVRALLAAGAPWDARLRADRECVTGTVGPIVTESVNVALTWVRSNADRLADLDAGLDDAADLHVHVGEAARSKDGAVSTCCTIQINGRNAADHRRLPRRGPRSTPRSDGQGWSTAAKADTVWLRLSRAASAGGKTRPVHRAWRLRGRQSRARLRSTHRTGKNQRAKPMGEIHADVTLENAVDRGYFRRGDRAEADIRRTTVDGIVDTGAVTLVLPQNVVERLGLEPQGTAFVTYADERREERPLAGPVGVQIGNRSMTMECIVGPPLSEVLIGQVVLERLDLIADCTNRTLTPPLRGLPATEAEGTRDKALIRSMMILIRFALRPVDFR